MRPAWSDGQQSCKTLHPSWTFRLWQDDDGNRFVRERCPHLYSTYRAYPLEIQRSNVLRYLLLDHYGGIYLDLGLRCLVSLDFLRNETFVTPPANPNGVNNAFIASTPHHPFWDHLISNLQKYDLRWLQSPNVINMMSTGCHLLSTMHASYVHRARLDGGVGRGK